MLDLADPDAVIDALMRGAEANRDAACRNGSIDEIRPPGRLIATGDLHDNPMHLQTLIERAGLTPEHESADRKHLTLHEIIHSDRLMNGMDFSYRVMAKVAHLKSEYPDHVHTLLANHELAQMLKSPVLKDGIKCVEAFELGLDYAFGGEAPRVEAAIDDFVRSMPLALRCHCSNPRGGGFDVLCSHSLPNPAMMQRFDPGVLSRDLTDDDYAPRQGSAHLMVWGRGYDAELLEDLVERWGVNWFILGHEHAEFGSAFVPPNAVILNSDHEFGVCLPLDLAAMPGPEAAMGMVERLSG
ncbi:MAG: metallophosphoesterase [Planctomycetota bacterium]